MELSKQIDFHPVDAENEPTPLVLVPSILIIDDDEMFGRTLSKVGGREGFPVSVQLSAEKLLAGAQIDADVAVIDYDLGSRITGLRVAEYLALHFPTLPVVLVSQSSELDTDRWPNSIKKFVHKSIGPVGILGAAFETFQLSLGK